MNKEEYLEYLKSLHWQKERRSALKRAEYRCQVCNTDDVQLEVHHRTYERLGCERPSDLFVLCENCHELFSQNGKLAEPDDDDVDDVDIDWDEEWEDEDTAIQEYEDEAEGQGRLRLVLYHAMNHPRISLGGGSLVLSVVVDVVSRFYPFFIVMGLGVSFGLVITGRDIALGLQRFLLPGSDQDQVAEDAERFADHLLDGYPIYEDQSALAKLRRLFRLEDGKVVDALPQKNVRSLPKKQNEKSSNGNGVNAESEGLTYERITTWFDEGRIDNVQFLALLDRIDHLRLSPQSENGESVKRLQRPREDGESPVKSHNVSPELSPLSPTVSPEEEESVLQAYFSIQRQKGKVTREDIKAALQLNNKKHYIVKIVCDKYGIAMPGGK